MVKVLAVLVHVEVLGSLLNFIFFYLLLSILLDSEGDSLLLVLQVQLFLGSVRLLRLSILKLLMNLRLDVWSWRNFNIVLWTNTWQKYQSKEISKHLFFLVIILIQLVHHIWLLIIIICKLAVSGGLIITLDHDWGMLLVLIIY